MRWVAALAGAALLAATGASFVRTAVPAAGIVFDGAPPCRQRECTQQRYNSALYRIDRLGAAPRQLTPRTMQSSDPAWSPDGRRIAFVGSRGGATGYQIYVMNADGSGRRKVSSGQVDTEPGWSPDGRRIVFRGNSPSGQSFDLYVVRGDGSGRVRLTRSAEDVSVLNPAWSPNGRTIAFERSRQDHASGVYVMNAGGGGLRLLALNGIDPAWSPGGRLIAFARNDGAGYQIYTMNAGGGAKRQVTRGGASNVSPAWSGDGKRIVFARDDRIAVINADGTGLRLLTRAGGIQYGSPDW